MESWRSSIGAARPRSSWSASRASARRVCWPSSPLERTRAGSSSSPAPRPSSSATCRSRSSWTRSTSTCEGSNRHRLAALDDDVRTELAHVFPSLTALATERRRRAPARALPQPPRGARAARAARVDAAARARARRPPLGRLGVRRAASERSCAGPRRRRCSSRWPYVRARCRSVCPPRSSGPTARTALTRIELGALSPEEARQLLGDAVDGADATVLYEESGGNPFYLEQLARSLDRADGAAAVHDETSLAAIGVPSTVAAALTEELALLPTPHASSWKGRRWQAIPSSPSWPRPRPGCPRAPVMEAVDELLQLDLLRTTDVPRRFRFRHPLVRRAVYEATAAGWRLGAHERCAEALAARGATASARAHHVERSAREGDADAAAVLREAGEEAVRLAPASAAHWFAEALRLLPRNAPAEERVELLLARAGALTAAGRFNDSHDASCSRRSRSCPTARTRCTRGSSAPAPGWRASSDDTSKPARASRAPSRACPTRARPRRWR